MAIFVYLVFVNVWLLFFPSRINILLIQGRLLIEEQCKTYLKKQKKQEYIS